MCFFEGQSCIYAVNYNGFLTFQSSEKKPRAEHFFEMPGARSKFHLKSDLGKVYFLRDVSGETLVSAKILDGSDLFPRRLNGVWGGVLVTEN